MLNFTRGKVPCSALHHEFHLLLKPCIIWTNVTPVSVLQAKADQ